MRVNTCNRSSYRAHIFDRHPRSSCSGAPSVLTVLSGVPATLQINIYARARFFFFSLVTLFSAATDSTPVAPAVQSVNVEVF